MHNRNEKFSSRGATRAVRTTDIRPPDKFPSVSVIREIGEYRSLFYFLAWRDVKVRYKQTVLGMVWAVIQPLTTMVVFSIVFGKLGNLPSDGVPYPVFTYTALLPWLLFSTALNRAMQSLVTDQSLVTKVYVPRLILPTASILSPLVDFVIAAIILSVLMFYYSITPTARIVCVPAFVLLTMTITLGAGLWLSAVNARYRDVRHASPFMIQLWMFASPVAYAGSLVPSRFDIFYGLNPMVSVIEGFRWALFGTNELSATLLIVSAVVSIIMLASGLYIFLKTEENLADHV